PSAGRYTLSLHDALPILFGAGGTARNAARNADNRLVLEVLQLLGELRIVMRLQLDLRDAFAVTQVDEDDAALVADRIHPAHERRSEEHTSELQSRENLVC